MTAVGYTRVSRRAGREQFISPDEQKRAIKAMAVEKGFEVVEWIEEIDKSGADKDRPGWNRAIEMVVSGKVDAFAVWNLSRFSRSVVDGAAAIKRIEAAGGKFFSAAGDSGDSSPAGRFQRTVFLAMAELERETKKEGFEIAQTQAIERGIFIGSTIPTGYSKNPETRRLEPNELAPVVTTLFEMRAEGKSWAELLRYFVAHGGSRKASRQFIQNLIANPTYRGWSRHGQKINEKAHPPLVSERLFEIANTKMVARKHTGRAAAESLLSGLVRCDGCGKAMVTTTSGHGTLSYRCQNNLCEARASCRVRDLDTEVVARLHAYWRTYQNAFVERSESNEEQISADIEEARKSVADATFLLEKFQTSKREYLKAMEPAEYADDLGSLKREVAEAQLGLEMAESAQTEPAAKENVADLWDGWSHQDRKEWLARTIENVLIKRAGGRPVPVGERMALGLTNGFWIHPKSGWSAEPFGEALSPLHIVARRKTRKAMRATL